MSSILCFQRIYGTVFYKKDALRRRFKKRQKLGNVTTVLSVTNLISSLLILKVGAGLPYWLPKVLLFAGQSNVTSLTEKLPMVTNTFILPVLMNPMHTRLLATGNTTVTTCSHQWTWVMVKCLNYGQMKPAPVIFKFTSTIFVRTVIFHYGLLNLV